MHFHRTATGRKSASSPRTLAARGALGASLRHVSLRKGPQSSLRHLMTAERRHHRDSQERQCDRCDAFIHPLTSMSRHSEPFAGHKALCITSSLPARFGRHVCRQRHHSPRGITVADLPALSPPRPYGRNSGLYCTEADGGINAVVQAFAASGSLGAGFVHFFPSTP